MRANYLYVILLCLLSGSCSNDAMNDIEIASTKSPIIVPVDSTNEVTVISSLEEFYLFLNEKVNLNLIENSYLLKFPELNPKATISTITKVGFAGFTAYEGCAGLKINVSDFQTADKLGITAHKDYYVTIGLAHFLFQLQSNQRPSVAESLECGLLLDNPRTDDFSIAQRGYVGQYNAQKSTFTMNTSLVFFVVSGGAPRTWFPCSPFDLKWNVNVLEL